MRWASPIDDKGRCPRAVADALSELAATGAFAQARRPARSISACGPKHLPDLLRGQRPRHLRRLRRRQIGVVVDAGAQCRRGHHGDRRKSANAVREVREFLRDGLGDEGLARSVVVSGDLRRARLDAAEGGLSDVGDRRILPRWRRGRTVPDGFGDVLRWPSAKSGCRQASRRPPRAIRRPYSPNCPSCSGAPVRGRRRHHHGASLRCWLTATTVNEPIGESAEAFWMAIS